MFLYMRYKCNIKCSYFSVFYVVGFLKSYRVRFEDGIFYMLFEYLYICFFKLIRV